MRCYVQEHRFYCGIDRHARTMHLCILDQAGKVVFDRHLPCRPETFLRAVAPFAGCYAFAAHHGLGHN